MTWRKTKTNTDRRQWARFTDEKTWEKFLKIQKELSDIFGFNFNGSQTLLYLVKNYKRKFQIIQEKTNDTE